MRATLGIGLLCLVPIGCSERPSGSAAADTRQCYVLDWRRGDSVLAGPWMPDSIELSSKAEPYRPLAGTGRFELYRASVAPDTVHVTPDMPAEAFARIPWHRRLFNHWWEPLPGDSVFLIFSDNWTDWKLRLGRTEQGWAGTGEFGSDAGDTASVRVTGRRFRCRTSQQVGA